MGGTRLSGVVALVSTLLLAGCSSGPSQQDCQDAKIAQAKFFEEDDPKMREAYYAVQVDAEAACRQWKDSQRP